jgi:hypothetical protein
VPELARIVSLQNIKVQIYWAWQRLAVAEITKLSIELIAFRFLDCPHLLAHHPRGMVNAPLTHPPMQGAHNAGIEAVLLALQALHGLLACKEGIVHEPWQHQGPAARRWAYGRVPVGAGGPEAHVFEQDHLQVGRTAGGPLFADGGLAVSGSVAA